MKITSFNVNGLRTLSKYYPWNEKSFCEMLVDLGDIICMQEIKATKNQLQEFSNPEGYHAFYSLHPSKGFYVNNKATLVCVHL